MHLVKTSLEATPFTNMRGLVKDILEHVVNVIVGKEDLMKVCQQEEQCKRFSSAWIRDKKIFFQSTILCEQR